MPLPKKSQTSEREARAWSLSLRGHTVREIAEILTAEGLPTAHSGAHAALKRVEARRRANLDADLASHTLAQLDRLEHLYAESAQAWFASKPGNRLAGPPATPGQPGPAPAPVPSRNPLGDPRYLAEARAFLADLRKLLGLDSPAQFLLGGIQGADPINVALDAELNSFNDEELEQLYGLLDRVELRQSVAVPDGPSGGGD